MGLLAKIALRNVLTLGNFKNIKRDIRTFYKKASSKPQNMVSFLAKSSYIPYAISHNFDIRTFWKSIIAYLWHFNGTLSDIRLS